MSAGSSRRIALAMGLGAGALAALAAPLIAQGYRARVNTRYQSVGFRGVTLDSVLASSAVLGADGGLLSDQGFAVTCHPGSDFCTFFRPGPVVRGGPLVTTVDVSAWGFGIPGLTLHSRSRIGTDLGRLAGFPGTDPTLQVLEGYVRFVSPLVGASLGRVHVVTRFGSTYLDGARAELKGFAGRLRVQGYGGWGLARGVVLPVTSDALDPLGDFRPRDRQIIAGGGLAWSSRPLSARAIYQREVDPVSDNFVSERVAFDGSARPVAGVTLSGGADYDLAFAQWGTIEGTLRYLLPGRQANASVGIRRYRPHFDLWSIWGAFSPTPYGAVFGTAAVRPIAGVELRGRGELYRFEESDAQSPLTRFENDGWRWSAGAMVSRLPGVIFGGTYHAEFGPGASSVGVEGSVTLQPIEPLTVTGMASHLRRPLEFRFDDATVSTYGLRIDYRAAGGLRLNVETRYYDESRKRPDAAGLAFNRLRVNLGASFDLGTGADRLGLNPAILRIPTRPRKP